jgi:hypothetical protein
MKRKLDDIISVVLALSVTVLFVCQTIASWPTPVRLNHFHVERLNPFTFFRTAHPVTARN